MNIDLTEDEIDAIESALGYYYAAHLDRGWEWPYYHEALGSAREKLTQAKETTE